MKLKAELGHWSSIVGLGVHLIGPSGRMEAQIAFLHHGDALRDREAQERLAKVIVDAINAAETDQ